MLAANMQHVVHHLSGETPSFEVMMFKYTLDIPVCCITIYCPPKPKRSFFYCNSLILFLLLFSVMITVLLVDDFNIHVNDQNNSCASEFLTTIF